MRGLERMVGRKREMRLMANRYHHLNHYSIFGGGYKGGAVSIMESLIEKYGDFESGTED